MSLKEWIAPFDPESEEDVRIRVAQYFVELGFEPDEMRFEDSFRITLGRNTLVVTKGDEHKDSLTGRADMLLTHAGKPFAIVETKRPGHSITDEDRDQAISYARLLQDIVPLAFVTNGHELQVYDVYTTKRLEESLGESVWQQKAIPDVGEDFRHEAARKLIGLNFITLREFCFRQRDMGMADLRGSINERKKYVPDLYISRAEIDNDFAQFLDSDSPCFAVVSESGIGKTNVLCALAEEYGSRFPTLFYWAARLPHGITDAIVDDFIWEFSRERHIAYVVGRIDALATEHDVPFLVFVDALDEYTGSVEQFRNELISFVQHLSGRRIKLCVSCKAFDWNQFVIDSGTTYNSLAKAVFPKRDEVHRPEQLVMPRPQDTGTWLEQFTDKELERSWIKYKSAYGLDGALTGETWQECHFPLLLRLVAETYSGSDQQIPTTLSHIQVFVTYWEQRLSRITSTQRHYATQTVCKAAEMMVVNDSIEIDESVLRSSLLLPTPFAEEAYESVLRLGLLERRGEGVLQSRLAFSFELLRPFVFTVLARNWRVCSRERLIGQFRELFDSSLGREAIVFFLTVVDRGTSELLTQLVNRDLPLFINLIRDQALRKSGLTVLSMEEQQELVANRIFQFASTYSDLLHTHFPNLVDRFEPYTTEEIGLAIQWPFLAFRPVTSHCPGKVLYLPRDTPQPDFAHDLRCSSVTNQYAEDLLQKLPQDVAWTIIAERLRTFLSEQFLDESCAPRILQEKVLHILLTQPVISLMGTPRGRYWQQLGYRSADELQATSVQELQQRVLGLIERFVKALVATAATKPWYNAALRDLLEVRFHLSQLVQIQSKFTTFIVDPGDLFSYHNTGEYDQTVECLQKMIVEILETYEAMVEHNFPSLVEMFPLYRHRDAQLVVEVSHPQAHHKIDYLQVLYLVLPSVESSGKIPVFFTPWTKSLAETSTLNVYTNGNLFSMAAAKVDVDDRSLVDAQAVFNRIQYPSRRPITDQVYQLMANEAESVFTAESRFSQTRGASRFLHEDLIKTYLSRRQREELGPVEFAALLLTR